MTFPSSDTVSNEVGIRPERIRPGKPTKNGRHERMHRTLEEDAIKSGKTKRVHWAQQRRRIRSSR